MGEPISATALMGAGNLAAGGFQIGGGLLSAFGQQQQMREAAHQTRRRASWSSFQLREQGQDANLQALAQEVQADQIDTQAGRRRLDAEQARIQAERLRAAAETGQAAANVTDQTYTEQLRSTLANLDASRAVAGVSLDSGTADALRGRISEVSSERRMTDVGNRRRAAERMAVDAGLVSSGAGLLDAEANAIGAQAGTVRAGAAATRASGRSAEIIADITQSDAQRSIAAMDVAGRSMMMAQLIRLIPRGLSMIQGAAPGATGFLNGLFGSGGGGLGPYAGRETYTIPAGQSYMDWGAI